MGSSNNIRRFIKNTSRPQLWLFNLVRGVYPDAELEYPLEWKGYTINLDIAVPSRSLDVEYDGFYWHLDKEMDEARDVVVQSLGWKVIRFTKEDRDASSIRNLLLNSG